MDIDFNKLPQNPGIYIFQDGRKKPLYIGRATDLRNRVRSYFSERLIKDRGKRLVEVIEKAKNFEYIETDSVLDAYILEANLIKKHQPQYNVIDKDNKSFQYVGVTDEKFPRVIIIRGREIELGNAPKCMYIFGPFPRGGLLKEALKVVRKILPYRDTCTPASSTKKSRSCLRAQIGLCPGVCNDDISEKEYMKRIQEIKLLFEGKKNSLLKRLEKEMNSLAKKRLFEEAEEIKRRIFSLKHIQDITLISHDAHTVDTSKIRIEAYDIAHTRGKNAVGVMVVLVDGEVKKKDYRTFNIKEANPGDDIGALREILDRRFQHPEWPYPSLIVLDGGKSHINAGKKIINNIGIEIPIVSVVKTDKHMPREILGSQKHKHSYEKDIVRANGEAHRFALQRHKKKRSSALLS